MESNRKTPSVIAELMGIDETPPRQQLVSRQQRVLSHNYLQKVGSIGKRSRKDSPSSVVGSKKRANNRTNNDSLSRDSERKSLRFDGMQGVKPPVVFGSDNDEKSGNLPKRNAVLRPNLGNVQHVSEPSFLRDSQTIYAWEAKKQVLERHKMNKVSKQQQPDFVKSIGIKSKEGWNHDSVAKLPIFKGLDFSSNRNAKSVKAIRRAMAINTKKNCLVSTSSTSFTVSCDAESATKNVESFHGDTKDRSNCSMKEECSSDLSDLSSEQGSPIRSHEDDSVSSNSEHTDEEHSDGKVESYQHSPNSVLETPFREDNSSSSECFASAKTDLRGLWMQLQLLKSESEENDSKPEMFPSSDSEISTCTDQNTISTILSGAKENRDFSYLVDVLNESGFKDGNMQISFKRWHSSECMAGPSVFETLEKKYGKQELWHKAERRLLFDRINSGMTDIVRPRVDIRISAKPLRRKMSSMLRRDVIEEELSALLHSQEKGVDDGVSEKAVGRALWFDPVDELDSLVTEIEIFLFDKLAAELVSA
ncbi:hypothetical protein M8C21_029214 [Ambrosia artemisiifolia]|uniref:DUF4378 domain-containing protein n=1 Tax=Ambrosia artemisiifolia TaxID=4212 RepID=A0AAD5GUD3_AMBAR|nr:hypothetical protein M8C21_029214 [Ambrosia artemisiifolia]